MPAAVEFRSVSRHFGPASAPVKAVDAVDLSIAEGAFFAMLQAQGIPLAATQSLPDHADFAHFSRQCGHDTPLLCTEKDAHKLWCQHPQAWAVPLQLQLPQAFWVLLDAELAAVSAHIRHQGDAA